MKIEIMEFKSEKACDKWIKNLNKQTANLYDEAHRYYYSLCENEAQKQIFNDWWNGRRVSTEEYKKKYNSDDHYQARSLILSAISRGFG